MGRTTNFIRKKNNDTLRRPTRKLPRIPTHPNRKNNPTQTKDSHSAHGHTRENDPSKRGPNHNHKCPTQTRASRTPEPPNPSSFSHTDNERGGKPPQGEHGQSLLQTKGTEEQKEGQRQRPTQQLGHKKDKLGSRQWPPDRRN